MKKPENLQDYFDNAWEWFVVFGNGPSVHVVAYRNFCRYRGPNGAKCVIGASIMDEDYDPGFEGAPASAVLATIGYPVKDLYDQVSDLQGCHDDLISNTTPAPGNFNELINVRLEQFAGTYNLVIPS